MRNMRKVGMTYRLREWTQLNGLSDSDPIPQVPGSLWCSRHVTRRCSEHGCVSHRLATKIIAQSTARVEPTCVR